jgi:type II secretory pathway pseudopilin PulG
MEMLVVLVVIGVLLALCAPSFHRAVEQARADVAAANLRAVWAAERLYWLDNHTYTSNWADLQPLLDPSIPSGTPFYAYAITAADGATFSATATRTGSSTWSGQLTVDQTGTVPGALQAPGAPPIAPGFQ